MHRRIACAIAAAVSLAGCPDANLVPCGDLVCPAGDVCTATTHRCATSTQAELCAGVPDGSGCTYQTQHGTCNDGACLLAICGNHVVDPGEACDDGNTVSGDGCSGNCLSDERCGNATVDVATGEKCDCGSAGAPSSLCAYPNSDDPAAECTLDCQLRYCGDGVVNTIEQCDGSVPAGVSCLDYGFYRGTPTCSALCQISPVTCSGKCGDGVVDPEEFCDTVVAPGDSCVSFGFDLGALACGSGCSPELAGCELLGWTRVGQRTQRPVSLWGGAGIGAAAYLDGTASAGVVGGTWQATAGGYTRVAGTASATVWAVGPAQVASWTPSGGWVAQAAPPWGSDVTVVDAWASDSLGLFVSLGDRAELQRFAGGAWTTVSGPWDLAPAFGQTTTDLWVLSDGSGYDVTAGGGSADPRLFHASALAEDPTGRLWAVEDGQVYRVGAAGVGPPIVTASAIAPSLDGVFAGFHAAAAGHHDDDLYALGTSPVFVADLPNGEFPIIASDGHGVALSAGPDGVYALRYGEWRTNGTTDFDVGHALTNGAYMQLQFGGATALRLDETGTFGEVSLSGSECASAGSTARGHVLAGCREGLFDDGALAVPNVTANALWASADGSVEAFGGNLNGVFGGATYGLAWNDGSGWQAEVDVAHITALAGDSIDDMFAIDNQSELIHFDGLLWTVLAADVTGAPVLTPTRVYYVGDAGLAALDRATLASAPVVPLAGIVQVAGAGGDQLYALAPADPRGSSLYFFDGAAWWPVRTSFDAPSPSTILQVGRLLLAIEHDTPAAGTMTWLQRSAPW